MIHPHRIVWWRGLSVFGVKPRIHTNEREIISCDRCVGPSLRNEKCDEVYDKGCDEG